jgi:hypothetical protein
MKSNSTILIAILSVAVVVLAYVAYDRRSRVEKAEDSLRDAARNVQDAIQPRTPGEKSVTE